MKLLLDKLNISVEHMRCLDEVFLENNEEYQRIENILKSNYFIDIYTEISRELYAGGKTTTENIKMARQMILSCILNKIFINMLIIILVKLVLTLKI